MAMVSFSQSDMDGNLGPFESRGRELAAPRHIDAIVVRPFATVHPRTLKSLFLPWIDACLKVFEAFL
jgi:hypothetical protein